MKSSPEKQLLWNKLFKMLIMLIEMVSFEVFHFPIFLYFHDGNLYIFNDWSSQTLEIELKDFL